MIKALESKATIILSKEAMPVSEAWFIMKNIKNKGDECEREHLRNYAALWSAKKIYECGYAPDVEEQLKRMSKGLMITSCRSS